MLFKVCHKKQYMEPLSFTDWPCTCLSSVVWSGLIPFPFSIFALHILSEGKRKTKRRFLHYTTHYYKPSCALQPNLHIFIVYPSLPFTSLITKPLPQPTNNPKHTLPFPVRSSSTKDEYHAYLPVWLTSTARLPREIGLTQQGAAEIRQGERERGEGSSLTPTH